MSDNTPTNPETAQERVLIEITIAAPSEVVWRALRDPAEISRWFGWDYAGLPEEIAFIFEKEAKVGEEGRTLLMPATRERFVLEPRGESTVVRLIRSAPADGWKDVYDDIGEGWTTFVHQLRFALERHRGAERRSLYLSGHADTAETPLPIRALGLAEIARITGDEVPRYTAITATGEKLTGEPWFHSPHQLGLTVDGYGDGLLVVTERPAGTDPKSPHGGGTAVITTYGLDDVAFSRLKKTWSDWWHTRYSRVTVQQAGDA